MHEYISAALSPAKISKIKLDKVKHQADVIVDDDQLSLAIGRHGQNVRLASKLVGWELNIRSKAAAKEEKKEKPSGEEAQEEEISLTQLTGVGKKMAESLKKAGFDSVEKISQAKLEDLTKIKGLGKKKAEVILDEAKGFAAEKEGKA